MSNARKAFQGRMKLVVPLVLLAVCCLLLPTQALASGGNPNPQVFPPDSHPFGHSYGAWSTFWWQWALSSPPNLNPVLDTTGTHCGVNQPNPGPVWFLAGTFSGAPVTRTCSVPAGKALLIPIMNVVNFGANADCSVSNDTVDSLRAQIAPLMAAEDPTTFTADVDGSAIRELPRYRLSPNDTAFTLTNISLPLLNAVFGLSCTQLAPSYLAVSDGYYVMLAPLSAGIHHLHFTVPSSQPVSQDTTYTLIVGR